MYSVLIALAAAAASGAALRASHSSNWFWTVFLSLLAFGAAFAAVNWILRRRIAAVMADMQAFMQEGQQRLQARIKDYQFHPKGDPRQFQDKLQREQKDLLREAIDRTGALERWRNWVPFMQRQINTTRMQLHYQLGEFDKVDSLLPKCLVLDPATAAMKLARQYANKAELPEMEKTFRKAKMRCRYDQSGLLYATWSWILVKAGKLDDAYKLLVKACEDNSVDEGPNTTLPRNRDLLANNRPREFNNAGFGDQWYALQLEQPKIRYERRAPTRFGKFG
ncbi:MAG: hypothetical protein IJV65_00720 [Kiritimatiellae bacterium]|nr:hypothetical protein [Kiritimatiellia bacterium]